jgi:acyl-coenzyme A thioesterase PaaI-like protein
MNFVLKMASDAMVHRYSDPMTPTPITDDRIAELRSAFDMCFGCGSQNPIGLRLDGFARIEHGVQAPFVPAGDFNGFHGIVHGGVVATALDEISAWSAIVTEGVFVFTAKLEIRYRAEARTGHQYVLEGLVKQRRGKRILIDATMTSDGVAVAESSGLFVVAGTVEHLIEQQRTITGQ